MPTLTTEDAQLSEYEYYEALFDPTKEGRRRRRKPAPRTRHIPKVAETEMVAGLGDLEGLEGGFETTYHPGRYEEGWLLSSLRAFYDQTLITDVLAQVKGGKEANVYCCAAHPSTGRPLLAAKVYRPHQFRTLRNDKVYREGRDILTSAGRPVKTTDHRIMRAIGKKSTFGRQVMHTSWMMHEYTAMERLYDAGGAVPQPVAASDNAILMGYRGDAGVAAPTLNEVDLDREEAAVLFQEVLRNVELMLQHHLVHGDLSAYNILYWEGEITLIDFPQVTDVRTNNRARAILGRDIKRVCQYFRRLGVRRDPTATLDELWSRYVEIDADRRAEDEFNWMLESAS